MKKKLVGSLVLLSTVALLSGCVKDNKVASINGEPINQSELYKELKSEYGTATLQTMLVNKTLEKKFGDKVSDDEVDKAYKDIEKQYGGEKQLENVISMYGYNDLESYKKSIKQNLLVQAMVKDSIKLSDKEYQDYFDNMVDFDLIQLDDENKAKEIISKINKGEKFEDLAYENSLDTYTSSSGGKVGLTDLRNTDTYNPQLMEAVSKLKTGELSKEPIKTDYGIFVVKVNKNLKQSGAKLEDYKEKIDEYVLNEKSQDSEYVHSLISKLLKEYNVEVVDEDLKDALKSFDLKDKTKTSSSKSKKETSDSKSKTESSDSKSKTEASK